MKTSSLTSAKIGGVLLLGMTMTVGYMVCNRNKKVNEFNKQRIEAQKSEIKQFNLPEEETAKLISRIDKGESPYLLLDSLNTDKFIKEFQLKSFELGKAVTKDTTINIQEQFKLAINEFNNKVFTAARHVRK